MGPGPYSPSPGPATELVVLLLATIGVLLLFVVIDVVWRRLRSRISRSSFGEPRDGV